MITGDITGGPDNHESLNGLGKISQYLQQFLGYLHIFSGEVVLIVFLNLYSMRNGFIQGRVKQHQRLSPQCIRKKSKEERSKCVNISQ